MIDGSNDKASEQRKVLQHKWSSVIRETIRSDLNGNQMSAVYNAERLGSIISVAVQLLCKGVALN